MRRIFGIGDSIAKYYGDTLAGYLAGVLEYDRRRVERKMLADTAPPSGISNGTSRMMRHYLESESRKGVKYDFLLLNCGLHDIKIMPSEGTRQVCPEEYGANLRIVSSLALKLANVPLWVSTTPVDDAVHNTGKLKFNRYNRDVIEYNGIAEGIMRLSGIRCIDLYTFTAKLGGAEIYCDHVHFSEKISSLQAAFIAGVLFSML